MFSGGGARDDHDLDYPIGSVSDMARGLLMALYSMDVDP